MSQRSAPGLCNRITLPVLIPGLILALTFTLCSCRSRPTATEKTASDATSTQEDQAASPTGRSSKTAPVSNRSAVSSAVHNFTPPNVAAAQWHDLLPLIDVKQDKFWGEWKVVDRELVGAPGNASGTTFVPPLATLILPAAPQGEYQLRLQLQLDASPPSATILLPVGSRQVAFSIGAPAAGKVRSGFEKIAGQRVDENPAGTSVVQPESGQPYQLDLIVLPKGDQVELYAIWDGQPAAQWKGPAASLSTLDEFTPPGEPAICVVSPAPIRIFAIQLGPLSGKLRLVRALPTLTRAAGLTIIPPPALPAAAPSSSSAPVPNATAAEQSHPPPTPATQLFTPATPTTSQPESAAIAKVQAKFSAEYVAAKKSEQKAALAKKLLDAADRDAADSALQTAEWDEARRMAAEGNDFRLALQSLERRNAKYPLDMVAGMASICQAVQLPANKRADNAALADLAAKWMERAIELDQADAATTLGTAAQGAIKKLSDRDRTKAIADRLTDVRMMQAEFAKLGPTAAKLFAGPPTSDAEANLAIGRYRCFFKNDWLAGLPNLAACSDAKLQAAAKKDLEYPTVAAARAAVADQWWDIAAKLPREARKNILRHAAEFYLRAAPSLNGAAKTTALNRIQEAVQTRPQSLPTLVSQGLVAYWSFDDASGRMIQDAAGKNHAYLIKGRWTQGVRGGAVEFTAAEQYVEFPRIGEAPAWTLAFWVRIDSSTTGGSLISTFGNQRGNFHLTVRNDGIIDAGIQESAGGSSQATLKPGSWRHVAFRYDNGCTLFVDGRPDRTFGANKDIPPIIGPGRIGAWFDDGTGQMLLGAVDDVRIYSRLLADSEIALLAESNF